VTEFAEAIEDAGLVALFDGSAPTAAAEVLASALPSPLPQPVIDLIGDEGITVLAPTNEAIDALGSWDDIAADETTLRHFVLAHVVPGQLDEEEIFAAAQVTVLSGDVLQVDPATQTINGAHLDVIAHLATNGIAHTVDAVLVWPQVTPTTTEESTAIAAAPPTAAPPIDSAPVPTPPPATGA
jgi:hypothetical protein